jgi:HD superfamily phosphohydrolase
MPNSKEISRLYSGVKRIYDEVHGYIELSEIELKIIDSSIFQRLRFIKQLAAAWYVYPGATHTRFSHSLGAMHIMGLIASRLASLGYIYSYDDVQLLRLAALLHDVGHTPFSHAIEPFYRYRLYIGHEDLSKIVILENSDIKEILSSYGYDPKTIVAILEGRYREPLYNQLLSSDLDVDRMDYLIRDALHTGVTYGSIDLHRIIATLVVDGEGNLAILDKGIDALENFYLARMHMYRAVYYHKTLVGYEMLLRKIYEYINEYTEDTLLPKSREDIVKISRSGEIALWHDDWFIGMMINMYREGKHSELKELIEAFFFRKGYKVIIDRSRFDFYPLDLDIDKDIIALQKIMTGRIGIMQWSSQRSSGSRFRAV